MSGRKRNAVVVRAGRRSTHPGWLTGGTPDFDLFVVAYELLPDATAEASSHQYLIVGTKVSGWSRFFTENAWILDAYDAIALLDDDLACTAQDINRCFAIGREEKLSLWQPSLTADSYFSYAIFVQNKFFKLRYVNFIEMMCPFFRTSYLKLALPLFKLGFETGIDRLWCCLSPAPRRTFAVIDAVAVAHTRSVGENSKAQGFVGERATYDLVLAQMEDMTKIRFSGAVAYAGLTRRGKIIRKRATMAALSLLPLIGGFSSPTQKIVKRFLTHFRHTLTRPINNDPIDLNAVSARLKPSA